MRILRSGLEGYSKQLTQSQLKIVSRNALIMLTELAGIIAVMGSIVECAVHLALKIHYALRVQTTEFTAAIILH
jgi:hypothetical protein